MCSPITCSHCGKPGWRGCGAHVEQILGHVPEDQRCKCNERESAKGAPAKGSGGFFDWLRSVF
jgi:hypothetical protein